MVSAASSLPVQVLSLYRSLWMDLRSACDHGDNEQAAAELDGENDDRRVKTERRKLIE